MFLCLVFCFFEEDEKNLSKTVRVRLVVSKLSRTSLLKSSIVSKKKDR